MKTKKKANKLIRHLRLSVKRTRKLRRKKVSLWLYKNLKGHPFIFGILFFIWVSSIISKFFENMTSNVLLVSQIKLFAVIFIVWLFLVVFSNALKDKEKVKWYFKKRFVFLLLVLFTPLGLMLLWTGARFKKTTKIIFTVIFTGIFMFSVVYQEKRYRAVLNMPSVDRVIEVITSRKARPFLRNAPGGTLDNFNLTRIQDKEKVKLAVSDIYSRCLPSVVSIKIKDRNGKQIGIAGGFVVSKDGIIITNSHVIESAHQVEIKIGDKTFREVYLVKNSPDFDMAILKIEAGELIPLPVADSDELVTGQFVVALGNPLGFEQSVSSGIISAMRSGRNMKLIQITAPLSPGSSGGPVLNEYGEVIGIATVASVFWAQNLNFAVPINYLEKIISEK